MAKIVNIPMETVRDNSFRLAKVLVDAGIFPTVIYAVARGGSYVANPISEYYKYIGREMKYGVVNAYSYKGINEQSRVVVEGWVPSLDKLSGDDRILIVDDVIDNRKTIDALLKDLERNSVLRRNLREPLRQRKVLIVSHDLKLRYDIEDKPNTRPDFFSNIWFVRNKDEAIWFNYLSHEMVGLTPTQVKENYSLDVKEKA